MNEISERTAGEAATREWAEAEERRRTGREDTERRKLKCVDIAERVKLTLSSSNSDGEANSATLPSERVRMRSQSRIVLSRWAITKLWGEGRSGMKKRK